MAGRRRRALVPLAALVSAGAVVAALIAWSEGDPPRRSAPAPRSPSRAEAPGPARTPPARPPAGEGLAVGLTETSAALLRAADPRAPDPLDPWRERLAALRPRYLRVMVDWAALQPDPAVAPDWSRVADGCSRGQAPCAPFAGIRDILRAAAARRESLGGFEVMVSIYGVPQWAARPPAGCERPDTTARSRPIAETALPAYRALIRSIHEMAAAEGIEIRWWSPWNEPNGPFFVSPQREVCDRAAPPVSPAVYATLARAMGAELAVLPGGQRLVIGELAGLPGPQIRGAGVEEFFAGLPDDVVCAAAVYAQHAYAERGDGDAATAPVEQLKAALDRRPCAAGRPIWITETGVGGPDVGGPRRGGLRSLRADCRALDDALRRWDVDPRVEAAFQYTFRDDPEFPVGLADATLSRTWPAYDLWLAWGADRQPEGPAPPLPDACAEP